MIEKIQVGDKIKAQFENFLGQIIVVEGIVRRIDGSENIVGNDAVSRHPFFVSLDEILEINGIASLSSKIAQSLGEVS